MFFVCLFYLFFFALFHVPVTNSCLSKIYPLRILLSLSFFPESHLPLFHEWTGYSLGPLHSCHPKSSLHTSPTTLLFDESSWEKGRRKSHIRGNVRISSLVLCWWGAWILSSRSGIVFPWSIEAHSAVSSGFQGCSWESCAMLTVWALTLVSLSSVHLEALLVPLSFLDVQNHIPRFWSLHSLCWTQCFHLAILVLEARICLWFLPRIFCSPFLDVLIVFVCMCVIFLSYPYFYIFWNFLFYLL